MVFGDAVVGKKALSALGSRVNDSAGSGMSAFARRILEKQGWSDGKGLGKNEDGMTSYVKVKQREEAAGLGIEEHEQKKVTESWWFNSFDQALQSLKKLGDIGNDDAEKKKKRKKEKRKKEKAAKEAALNGGDDEYRAPTYDELFKATGGKRLGMRARASQKGKLERTEGQALLLTQQRKEVTEEEDLKTADGKAEHKVSTSVEETTTVVTEEVSSMAVTDDDEERRARKAEKKRRKEDKKRKREAEQAAAVVAEESTGDEEVVVEDKKSKKRKEKKRAAEEEEEEAAEEVEQETSEKKKKRKKKQRQEEEE